MSGLCQVPALRNIGNRVIGSRDPVVRSPHGQRPICVRHRVSLNEPHRKRDCWDFTILFVFLDQPKLAPNLGLNLFAGFQFARHIRLQVVEHAVSRGSVFEVELPLQRPNDPRDVRAMRVAVTHHPNGPARIAVTASHPDRAPSADVGLFAAHAGYLADALKKQLLQLLGGTGRFGHLVDLLLQRIHPLPQGSVVRLCDAPICLTVTRKRFEARTFDRVNRDRLPVLMHHQTGAMRTPLHFKSNHVRLGFSHIASSNS